MWLHTQCIGVLMQSLKQNGKNSRKLLTSRQLNTYIGIQYRTEVLHLFLHAHLSACASVRASN